MINTSKPSIRSPTPILKRKYSIFRGASDEQLDEVVRLRVCYENELAKVAPLMNRIADYALDVLDGNNIKGIHLEKDALLPICAMESIYKKIAVISSDMDRQVTIRHICMALAFTNLSAGIFSPSCSAKLINVALILTVLSFLFFVAIVVSAVKLTGEIYRQKNRMTKLLAENMVQKFKLLLKLNHNHQKEDKLLYEIKKEITKEEHSCISAVYQATTSYALCNRRNRLPSRSGYSQSYDYIRAMKKKLKNKS